MALNVAMSENASYITTVNIARAIVTLCYIIATDLVVLNKHPRLNNGW